MSTTAASIRDGLERLGVKRLLLAIHDTSFPSDPDEDIGRGSPATKAAARLFRYARDLGFTGIQLGPQGQTTRGNPSPYDGTIFSRHIGNISLASFRTGGPFEGLLPPVLLDAQLIDGGTHARHHHAHDASHALVAAAYRAFERGVRADLTEACRTFQHRNSSWLFSDAMHAVMCRVYGGAGFRRWSESDQQLWVTMDRERFDQLAREHWRHFDEYTFGQFLVHEEHARVRRICKLQLYGDVQVGYSDADAWRYADVFLPGYLMGAPPSRTNPEGQPWGYPVLDPEGYAGSARALVVARAEKAFTEYDGLRIDHPHGLVCPWVYRAGTGDDAQAVRDGARLFESPDLPDHPALARYAIARADQIVRDCARHDDGWVDNLDDDQIARYATLVDAIVEAAEHHGRSRADLSCEVLSTMPTPLARVLARHGLGRWRVTQKANLDDPSDVYRTENAAREDWVMLGNHDTAPIFAIIGGWSSAYRDKWARHLAARLRLADPGRLASDRFLASAMLAELFVSRAENVSIFFADLFGLEDRFNVPGLVDDANWSLRLPHDFEALHERQLAREHALDLPLAVDLALASGA
jgi:4-alpha-glucanotransferase